MDTQENIILEWLQSGKDITALDALKLCGCFRLSARIFNLRAKGYNILTFIDEVQTAHGHTARIARYSLAPEVTT